MDDIELKFKEGDIVELRNHISDGYTEWGDYNVIFPPPTLVEIVDFRDNGWLKYGVRVLRESELPKNLQGTQFRAVMADNASNGKITLIGEKNNFFSGDEGIEDKYFDKVYWQPESYLRAI